MKTKNIQIELDAWTVFEIDDLIECCHFKDRSEVLEAAINALKVQMSDKDYTDKIENDKEKGSMDHRQLSPSREDESVKRILEKMRIGRMFSNW